MAAPIRLKCDPEIFIKKGGDNVVIGTDGSVGHSILIFHDELPELIEVLTKIIKEKK